KVVKEANIDQTEYANKFEYSNESEYAYKSEDSNLLTSFKESKKDLVTKKVNGPFSINASYSKTNNPEYSVYINKIVNKYNYHLSIEMIKFEETLLSDESTEFHVWIFEEVLKATGKQPRVIITNANTAVDSAVCQVFSQSYPIYCAFHLIQNINKHLRNCLADDYKKFIEAFYICRNSLVKEIFERSKKKIYRKLYSTYKKALNKALTSRSNSQWLINLLKEFTENDDKSSENLSKNEVDSDKENKEFVLKNSKKRCGKDRLAGTKRLELAYEQRIMKK
ncbi:21241_t:CDS:2, partial [Gigaspora margarita]